ncbi:hypothetical protein AAEX28_03740 [Lentisphaerota bacterium WC36G]|nr:hypothetical protein LJT99_06615 [Lentisphaerae bacterium WC36]
MENNQCKNRLIISVVIVAVAMFLLGFSAGKIFSNMKFGFNRVHGNYQFKSISELESFVMKSLNKSLALNEQQQKDITPVVHNMFADYYALKRSHKGAVENLLLKYRKDLVQYLNDEQTKKLIQMSTGRSSRDFLDSVNTQKK